MSNVRNYHVPCVSAHAAPESELIYTSISFNFPFAFDFTVNRRNSVVLSVGTGETRSQITSSSPVLRWGLFQWASRVVDILYDASEVSCHQTLQMILGDRYHRINKQMAKFIPLDSTEPKQLQDLLDAADTTDLTETVAFVKQKIIGVKLQRSKSDSDLSRLSTD
eukprot:m.106870 g.106870  ORF g.106870 m.106870 type:complete len:165 (-) comp13311_c0_seq4:345-839(-)